MSNKDINRKKKMKLYRELFSSEILSLFSDYSKEGTKEIEDMEISENDISIDIDRILAAMHISVGETLLDSFSEKTESGDCIINVDIAESPEEKRYTKAYEMVRLLLSDTFSREASALAMEILMPKNLVAIAVDLYQTRKNLTDSELEKENPMMFTILLAREMKVPMSVMRQRLIELNVLVYEGKL